MFTPDKIKTYLDSAFGAIKSIVNVFISFIWSLIVGIVVIFITSVQEKIGFDQKRVIRGV